MCHPSREIFRHIVEIVQIKKRASIAPPKHATASQPQACLWADLEIGVWPRSGADPASFLPRQVPPPEIFYGLVHVRGNFPPAPCHPYISSRPGESWQQCCIRKSTDPPHRSKFIAGQPPVTTLNPGDRERVLMTDKVVCAVLAVTCQTAVRE